MSLLHNLYDYANKHNLIKGTIKYTEIRITHYLDVNANGDVKVTPSKDKKGDVFHLEKLKKTSNIAANPLWDCIKYFAGEKGSERRNATFWNRASEVLTNAGLKNEANAIHKASSKFDLGTLDIKGNCFAIRYNGKVLIEDPKVKSHLSGVSSKAATGDKICLISNENCTPTRLHPQAKLPGLGFTTMVSFNAATYSRYGLTQGDNFPTSPTAASAYGTALEKIAADNSVKLIIKDKEYALLLIWSDCDSANVPKIRSVLDAGPKESVSYDFDEPNGNIHFLVLKKVEARASVLMYDVFPEKFILNNINQYADSPLSKMSLSANLYFLERLFKRNHSDKRVYVTIDLRMNLFKHVLFGDEIASNFKHLIRKGFVANRLEDAKARMNNNKSYVSSEFSRWMDFIIQEES